MINQKFSEPFQRLTLKKNFRLNPNPGSSDIRPPGSGYTKKNSDDFHFPVPQIYFVFSFSLIRVGSVRIFIRQRYRKMDIVTIFFSVYPKHQRSLKNPGTRQPWQLTCRVVGYPVFSNTRPVSDVRIRNFSGPARFRTPESGDLRTPARPNPSRFNPHNFAHFSPSQNSLYLPGLSGHPPGFALNRRISDRAKYGRVPKIPRRSKN